MCHYRHNKWSMSYCICFLWCPQELRLKTKCHVCASACYCVHLLCVMCVHELGDMCVHELCDMCVHLRLTLASDCSVSKMLASRTCWPHDEVSCVCTHIVYLLCVRRHIVYLLYVCRHIMYVWCVCRHIVYLLCVQTHCVPVMCAQTHCVPIMCAQTRMSNDNKGLLHCVADVVLWGGYD